MTGNVAERLQAIRGLEPLVESERRSASIKDCKAGGYLKFENETWQIRRLMRYLDVKWSTFKKRKTDYWITELELFGLVTGATRYIEWELDDELEIAVTTDIVELRDINYKGKPVKHQDLEDIAYEEEGEVRLKGVTYSYDEDETWAGLYYPDENGGESLRMRAYEFCGPKDKTFLTIEAWLDEDGERPEREAFVSRPVKRSEIEVLQPGPSGNA
ncbi:MAG: hypothetical protein OEZ10_00760 [Gammaproteobacteria bacterium]|nr:hypothetical protein [Gammaproteobacteria bacterium]